MRVPEGDDDDLAHDAFEQMRALGLLAEGPELRVVAVNAAMRRWLGARSVLGRPLREAFGDLADQQIPDLYDEVFRTGQAIEFPEWRAQLTDPNGPSAEMIAVFAIEPLRRPDGEVYAVLGTAIDHTEAVRARMAAEAEVAAVSAKYAQARDVVSVFQRALLPTSVPVLSGVHLAARYLLAAEEQAAGGDWFDAVVGAGDVVTLVVGDVVGHGVTAAATMGQLRAVLLQQLESAVPLESALEVLDRFATSRPTARTATVCAVELDRTTGALRYCTAGHPPPLVVSTSGGTARYLTPTGAAPLGTGGRFRSMADVLGRDDVLVLYSDGIIERPGRSMAQSTVELQRTATATAANTALPLGAPLLAVERVTAQTIELLTRLSGYADDITMLAAQLADTLPDLVAELPAVAGAGRTARSAIRSWLQPAEVDSSDVDVLLHAVTELVQNSVEHGYRDVRSGTVDVHGRLGRDGCAVLTVHDHGRWRVPAPGSGRGFGLALVGQLADQLHVAPGEEGTTVTVRQRLCRSAGVLDTVTASRHDARVDVFATSFDRGEPPRLVVQGPVDASSASTLRVRIAQAAPPGTAELVVDLGAVTLLASAGVDALYRVLRDAERQRLRLRLVAPSGSVAHHVLVLTALPHHEKAAGAGS